jgi:hypothetical protein
MLREGGRTDDDEDRSSQASEICGCRYARGEHWRYRRHTRLSPGTCLRADDVASVAQICDFVPVSDQLLRGKITEECQKALGIKLNIETIEGNGIQPRITSAIQSATGPDIIMAINNWPQLYGDSVADVSDVAEEIGNALGGYYETAITVANDGKRWIAVPFTILGVLLTNRKSWWADIGYNAENFPLPGRSMSVPARS